MIAVAKTRLLPWLLATGFVSAVALGHTAPQDRPGQSAAQTPTASGSADPPDNAAPAIAASAVLPQVEPLPKPTPRAALRVFLMSAWDVENSPPEHIAQALQCMDLAERPTTMERGLPLVQKLGRILDVPSTGVDLSAVPDDNRSARVDVKREDQVVQLVRGRDGQFRFSRVTLSRLDAIYDAVQEARRERGQPEEALEVAAGRRSPRATMATFLKAVAAQDLDSAQPCLDLSEIPAPSRGERGRDLAKDLRFCIERLDRVIYQTLPDAQTTSSPYLWKSHPQGKVVLVRVAQGDAKGEWRFSPTTLKSVDALVAALNSKPAVAGAEESTGEVSRRTRVRQLINRLIPQGLRSQMLGLEYWQWLGLGILILLGLVVDRTVIFISRRVIGKNLVRRGKAELGESLKQYGARPVGLVAMAGLWWLGLRLLALDDDVLAWLLGAVKLFAAVAGVWTAYRMADVVAGYLEVRARGTASRYDDLLVPLIRKSIKIFVTLFGLVFIAQTMNWEISTLLAGLGISGLAIGFAAKDSLGNLLGSVVVLLDRPFHIGDWVIIGDREGTVESVGFRSTRLRTFYNSVITIPNADCVNNAIDNMGARVFRRVSCMISVLYATTPEQLEAFCEGIRELVRRHPYTRKDYFHVYVNAFAPSSIDILLYCFLQTPDWATELREKHRLFIDIMRLAKELGVEFAFPTQTIHLERSQEAAPQRDLGSDTHSARGKGVQQARQIVHDGLGPHGHIPPPVGFEGPVGFSDDDADGAGDG